MEEGKKEQAEIHENSCDGIGIGMNDRSKNSNTCTNTITSFNSVRSTRRSSGTNGNGRSQKH